MKKSIVIAVMNNKGGVGKTFLAVHLAWIFQERGYRTLLADFDIDQWDAMRWISQGQLKNPEVDKIYTLGLNLDAVLVKNLKLSKEKWDRIVIDGRPDVFILGKGIDADTIIIPVDGRLSRENAEGLIRDMEKIGRGKVVVVLNKALKGTRIGIKEYRMCEEMGWNLYPDPIPHYAYVRIAEEDRIPVWKVVGAKVYIKAVLSALASFAEYLARF